MYNDFAFEMINPSFAHFICKDHNGNMECTMNVHFNDKSFANLHVSHYKETKQYTMIFFL